MFSFFRRGKKARTSQPAMPARKFVRRLPLYLERLEDRTLLSGVIGGVSNTDTWIGPNGLGGSGNWDVGSNWSNQSAPGYGGTAFISTSSAATITIQPGDNINVQSITTGSNDTLSFTGGSLTVIGGTSTLSGALDMTGGSLSANNAGTKLTVNGSTTITGANLSADNGATLSLPQLTSYVSNSSNFSTDGAGSVLDVSALTNVTQTGGWSVDVNGGEIDLSGLTSLSSTKGISINDNGTLLLSKLAAMDNVNLTVMRASSLALADLTNADGSSLSVNSGGSLSLPELVSYAANGSTFSADGSGSVLDVSALTTLTQNGNWYIDATNSGEINLDGLTSLNSIKSISVYDDNNSVLLLDNLVSMNNVYNFTVSGASLTLGKLTNADGSNFSVQSGGKLTLSALKSYAANGTNFSANGSGSLLDVSALTTLTQNGSWEINAANSGEINLSGLTSLNGSSADPIYLYDLGGSSVLLNSSLTSLTHVNATLDGTDQQVAEYWTSFTNGNLTVQKGASLSLANLISADGSNLSVSGGGSLSLPELTSYAANKTTFSVDGSGSLLDVSALKTLTQNNSWGISVTNSGEINLDGLTSLNSTKSISVYDSNNSVLLLDNLVSMNNVYNFTVSGAALTLAKLTNADGSSFSVQSGGSLSLPELTSYASNGSNFQAIGTNSVLDVSALTTLTQNGSWSIEASDGGEINLNGLTSLTSTQGISINDSGTLLLDNLASMDKVNLTVNVSSLTLPLLTDSGTSSIQLYGAALNLPVLTKGNIPLSAGTSLTIQGTAINMPANGASGATINVPSSQGLTITLQNNVNTLTDTTFNVGQGSNLVLTGGTYLGTTTFNVGQGATVDLTGGSQTTYGGVLTGSGAGTVLFSSGTLYPAVGGVTLNFTGNMFQWTGGAIEASVGDVTNLGTINLAGSNDKQIYADGTLFNYGTIIQTGNGNFDLHSDNISPTTLNNEAGGLYLLESDSGINNLGLGDNVLINAGIIRKTAGTGTSTFYIPSQGYISNTGTIEADSGTLFLDASSISQVASNTLTRGTWNALNGATLEFPNGTNITTNDANIRLDGSGAAIAALAGLNANNGTLSLTNGADFTTTGDLSNSGSLTVGAGSTLTVKGNYTQTAAGTLNDQIGGTPTSGQFGQVAVQKSANLDGNFNASLVNSYGPTAGQNFPVMTFASANGNFTHLTGLNPFFTESLNAANLELTDAATNAVSLGLSNVTAPTTATTGQQIAVNWQVNNSGSNDAAGNWQDSVYLSTTPTITSNSILLGSVTHSGGLAAGNSYNGSLTAAVPAAPPGYYYVLVQADSTYQEPVVNRANLTLTASTGQLQVSVPALTLGTPASGAFTAADQDQYYQVTVPSGGSLQVALSSTASSGALAVYVSQGTLPTTYNYQEAADFANQANQTVTVPQVTTGGTYYILVHSISGAAATAGFTLTANQSGVLSISGIGSSSAGNAGNATVEIDGANFTSKTTASLSLGATTIIASAIDFVSASQIFATFDLSGAATGNYTLSVQSGSSSAAAPTPFQVVTASAPALQVTLETPEYVRSGRTANLVISYTNTGNNDLVAPVLDINSTNANVLFSTPNDPNDFVQSAMLLAVAPNGHAGWLSPGQTGQITITILSNDTISGDQIPIQVGQLPSGEPLDLSLPPIPGLAGLNANVANIIFDNEKTVLGLQYNGGFTSDSFDYALAEAATYLGDLGETTTQVSDVGLLWSFLLAQADGDFPTSTLGSTVDAALPTPGNLPLAIDRTFQSSIIGRSTESLFGLGWTTSWQTFLSVDSSGNVTIDTGDSSIDFVSQVNGSFLDVAGEAGSLSLSNGVYTFTSTNGSQFVFFSQATNPPRDPYLMLS